MKQNSFWIVIWAVLSVMPAVDAYAAEPDRIAVLEKRLEDLESEVRTLRSELAAEKTKTASGPSSALPDPAAPVVTASEAEGFSIRSADEAFRLRVRGLMQIDSRFFTDNDKTNGTTDTFLIRRARPIFEGELHEDFYYYFQPSFDNGTAAIQDAYLEYRYAPELNLRAGKFKAPFGLERLQSISATNFVELAHPTALAPNRDVGVQLSGDLAGGVVGYAVALSNGGSDGASVDADVNNDKDVTARVWLRPFQADGPEWARKLGGGAAVSHGHKEGTSLPTLKSPGQATIFSYASGVSADGPHTRFSPQVSWYWNSLGVLGEYVTSNQELIRAGVSDRIENRAWQASAAWVLTGEDASYNGVVPERPFDLSTGDWGAWELVGRYHELDVDDAAFGSGGLFANSDLAVSEARSWGVGTNWYLNRNLRVMLDFESSEFDGGAAGGDRETENAVLTRLNVAY